MTKKYVDRCSACRRQIYVNKTISHPLVRVWSTRQTADGIRIDHFSYCWNKIFDQSILRKEEFLLVSSYRRSGHYDRKVWYQECEVPAHVMSTVRKQKVMNAGIQLSGSFPLFHPAWELACWRGLSTFSMGLPFLVKFLWTPLQICPEVCLLEDSKSNEVKGETGLLQGSGYLPYWLFSNKTFHLRTNTSLEDINSGA